MNSADFNLTIDYLGSSGIVLTPEQRAALQTSLVILKNEQKFSKLYLWGKIKGIKEDYFIAQGVGKDEMFDRKALYSKDCMHWGLLPPATSEIREKARLIRGRFTGDPSHEFERVEIKKVPGEGDEIHEEEETVVVKEEDRLAAVVAEIDHDVFIVPRGAYIRTPTGQIVNNRSFEGLPVSDCTKLFSFSHFREAIEIPKKPLVERAQLDKALDFMDNIEEDIPKGSWSMQFDRGSGLLILKSLLWPGFVFYHVPGTRHFGSVYFGLGEKNIDLPFML
jgi:radial spoke head protein 9